MFLELWGNLRRAKVNLTVADKFCMTELPVNLIYTDTKRSIPARLRSVSDGSITAYSAVQLEEGTRVTMILVSSRFDLEVVSSREDRGEFLVEVKSVGGNCNFSELFSHIAGRKVC